MQKSVRGRPSKYTKELADEICERMALGESVNQICKDERMPSEMTVRRWNLNDVAGFSSKYARARQDQYEHWAGEILDIADERKGDWEESGANYINRARLRVDSRKWLLSKLAPKQYGDRLTHAGDADNPVAIQAEITGALDAFKTRVLGISTAIAGRGDPVDPEDGQGGL